MTTVRWTQALPAHPEVLGAPSVFSHVTDGQHAPHGAVAVLLQVLVDQPVEAHAQLRQHRVHVLAVHGLPHVLHLPADVDAHLGAGLAGGKRSRESGDPSRCLVCGLGALLELTVVYWIMTLFSSSGLKSVFFCSVARMYFIWPTIQLIVLRTRRK